MLLLNKSPVTYQLCDQAVSVYHADNGTYTKKLYPKAFLDYKKVQNVDKTGSHESNSFLLVVPGDVKIYAGDKVVPGDGPEITTREEWADFIPSKVSGLVVVKYVDPKMWAGRVVHVEAGG